MGAAEILNETLQHAASNPSTDLTDVQLSWITWIVQHAEDQKAVLTVLITSLVKKIETPQQDIRFHQVELTGGYSGRGYDTQFITPFMKKNFPRFAMAESGWLTRSMEQPAPFTTDFPGRIRNRRVKEAFLNILDDLETSGASPHEYLITVWKQLLESQQSDAPINSFDDRSITVQRVVELLIEHFALPASSRLPVLAIYALYPLYMDNSARYLDKQLVPLKHHTSADRKSHSIADIEIVNADGSYFEAIEIKAGKPIDEQMILTAFEKIRLIQVQRYYLLTTAEPNIIDQAIVNQRIGEIHQRHGCEIIANGIIPTLKYYLRGISSPADFVHAYGALLLKESKYSSDVKQVHLDRWFEWIRTQSS